MWIKLLLRRTYQVTVYLFKVSVYRHRFFFLGLTDVLLSFSSFFFCFGLCVVDSAGFCFVVLYVQFQSILSSCIMRQFLHNFMTKILIWFSFSSPNISASGMPEQFQHPNIEMTRSTHNQGSIPSCQSESFLLDFNFRR